MEAEIAPPARAPRPILITLCCLIGFAGVPLAAYLVFANHEAILAFNGWSFIIALTIFGSMGLAGLIGYWQMRRWGVFLYAAMTVLSLLYARESGAFNLPGSISSIAITAIGCAYFGRMK
ncbi:MAG TPA: hypothetical protein VMD75_00865 [Candidatus Binataceae bacterium]|nr:hypothetical protein [Candidatus Binataceae bacterium]